MTPTLILRSVALGLGTAAALGAQALCDRPETQLSSGLVTTSVYGFAGWQIAAPKLPIPADPVRGLVHTARVMYAIWPDRASATSSDIVLRFLRSTDGGWSWDQQNAIDIWTANTAAGETFDAGGVELIADGNNVFVVISADRGTGGQPDPQQRDFAWVLGSDDQGQTWQSVNVTRGIEVPLSTGDQLFDVDNPVAAASNGRCHVLFEADYTFAVGISGASGAADVFYNAVEFDAQGNLVQVFAEERRMESTLSGQVDTDFPGIAASGNQVIMTWQDDRASFNAGLGSNNKWNDTYSRASSDGGATIGAEHNHTNQPAPLSWADNRQSKPAALGATLLVFQEDGRNGEDDVFVSRSTDGGQSWVDNVRASTEPAGVDVDGFNFDFVATPSHPAGRVMLQWKDDRQGPGNLDNDTYGTIDYNGGADFVAGIQQEITLIDTPTNTAAYTVDSYGDVIACASETSSFPEDAGIAFSLDDGQTWQWRSVLQFGNADCDDIYVAVTQNRDIMGIWQDDDNQGNNFNNVYVRGLKSPLLEDLTAQGQGIRLTTTAAVDQSDVAVLLGSLAGPGSNGFVLDRANGLAMNLIPDGLTVAIASNLGLFISIVDSAGQATWQQPNWAQIIGAPITWSAALIDVNTNVVTEAYTDPLVQR